MEELKEKIKEAIDRITRMQSLLILYQIVEKLSGN